MSVQLADSHLVYIGVEYRHGTRYAVHLGERGGRQLGFVERSSGSPIWHALDPRSGVVKSARTRWGAATALWGRA